MRITNFFRFREVLLSELGLANTMLRTRYFINTYENYVESACIQKYHLAKLFIIHYHKIVPYKIKNRTGPLTLKLRKHVETICLTQFLSVMQKL